MADLPEELVGALTDAIRRSTPEEIARLRELLHRPGAEGSGGMTVMHRAESGASTGAQVGGEASARSVAEGSAWTGPSALEIAGEPIDIGLRMLPGSVTVELPTMAGYGSMGEISITALERASKPVADVIKKWGLTVTANVAAGIIVLAYQRATEPPQACPGVTEPPQVTIVVPEPGLSSHARVVLEAFSASGATTTTVQALAASTSLSLADVELAVAQLAAPGLVVELAPGVFGLR